MIKHVSLGLALVASALGGFAGIHLVNKPAAPAGKAATIHCDLNWDVPDPAVKTVGKSSRPPLLLQESPTTKRAAEAAVRGYIYAPYELLPAKRACTGGDPLEVTWESWIGSQHIDDLWFLNSSTDEVVAALPHELTPGRAGSAGRRPRHVRARPTQGGAITAD